MPSLAITWAKRLKRVFSIEIETCSECGGDVRIVASIEDPAVIQKILAHLNKKGGAFCESSIAGLPGFAEPAGRFIRLKK